MTKDTTMKKTNDFPVAMPVLKLAKAERFVCAHCKRPYPRYPAFLGDDGYWQCERCMCTSAYTKDARAFGPHSADWEWIAKAFADCWSCITPDLFDSVVTEPPMASLDWKAIRAWERKHGIYTMGLYVSVEEVEPGHWKANS